MTAALAILKVAWPYMLAGGLGFGIGLWSTHAVDTIALNRQKAAMAGWQAQQADKDAAAEQAAREALQRQADESHATDQRNEAIINDLHARADSAESDLQLARSLLSNSLETVTPTGHKLPEGASQSGASGAGGNAGVPSLETQVAATLGECQRNAERLNALIAQVKPQVEP